MLWRRYHPPLMPARRILLFALVCLGFGLLAADTGPAQSSPEAALAAEAAQALAAEDAELPEAPAEDPEPALPEVPSRIEDPPLPRVESLTAEADLLRRATLGDDGRLKVSHDGEVRTLTVLPQLQQTLTGILQRYETPYAAVAVVDPSTGQVLALAEHSQARPGLRGLPLKAAFPAASIFKIVTAAALLEEGVAPGDRTCSHGGFRRVTRAHLEDTPKDKECFSLSRALGLSANGVFAKRTVKDLDAQTLLEVAGRFGFNRTFDFPMPLEPSLAAIPEEGLPLAQAGAGFGDAFLSPLHGALLAAVPATGGLLRAPLLFVEDEPQEPTRVVDAEHALALADMLEETVTHGTARRIFRERGFKVEGAVGKTGSLADKRPFRDYSWFVGYAPKDDPKVAVAAVVGNDPYWRIRATWLGREALRHGLKLLPEEAQQVAAAKAPSSAGALETALGDAPGDAPGEALGDPEPPPPPGQRVSDARP